MDEAEHDLQSISDTALWVAVYRARETERRDALFRDHLARRLAGVRGERIAQSLTPGRREDWPFVARTHLFDQFIAAELKAGADMIVNLAAGLDARPYRMELPASLRWVEVDLPSVLDYKETVLRSERPRCQVERIRLDLAAREQRRELFAQLAEGVRRAVVVSEGLLVYMEQEQVATLAEDLAVPATFSRWILDIASPGLLWMLQERWSQQLGRAAAPLQFAPEQGPEFFVPYGWRPIRVESMLKTAARLKRVSWFMRLLALLPESTGKQGNRPWSGVCRMARAGSAQTPHTSGSPVARD